MPLEANELLKFLGSFALAMVDLNIQIMAVRKLIIEILIKPGAYPRDFDWGGRDGELPPQSGALGGQRLFSPDLPI